MSRIQVLSDILASQVAAGEVVERPASVVKELVENSLDAGSRRIEVLIRRGGVALIRVVDDGHGMDREDALRCLERHATSKIRTKEDLGAIRTLGFRGEALPSIASVAKFTLCTREHGAISGTKVIVEGGKTMAVEDSGEAPGTQIEVRNLFFNVPARRKFLRSEATEFSHIEQHLRVQAMAHPEVSFSLTHDDRLVFHLPGGSSLLDRIRGLAGVELAERLLEVPEQTSRGVRVRGYIGEAGVARSNRGLCLTFLNGRPVESPVFLQSFRAAYGEALPRGQHPVAFLFVEVDPAEVDVNVHPAKREVRFRDGIGVQAALTVLLGEVVRRGRLAPPSRPAPAVLPEARDLDVADALAPKARPSAPPKSEWRPPVRQPELIPVAEQTALRHDWAASPQSALAVEGPASAQKAAAEIQPHPASQDVPKPNPYRLLGIMGLEYAVMESDEGLVLMDFRAAWERVLFEEARNRAQAGSAESQRLLVPITLQVAPREFDFIRGQLAALRQLGFGIDEFGANTIKIDALPAAIQAEENAEAIMSDLLDDLRLTGERAAMRRLDLESVAASVSRQAARLRPPQAAGEIDALVSQLLACEMPYCCPAGRATLVQISRQELARKFGKR